MRAATPHMEEALRVPALRWDRFIDQAFVQFSDHVAVYEVHPPAFVHAAFAELVLNLLHVGVIDRPRSLDQVSTEGLLFN